MDFRNKRVLVMGLGVHGGGIGVARYLAKHGAHVTVTDLKPAEQLRDSLAQLEGLPIDYVLGEHRQSDVLQSDMVVRNPGVPREHPLLQLAREHNIPVEMEVSLFFLQCPAPIVGITGTKGKTTTTLLTGAMLKEKDPRTVVAGNLRVSALELLPRIDATTPVVLELSSWQCEGLEPHRLSPHIAGITNLYPDHLNRYRDMADYAAAKALIFVNQKADDCVVLNADQDESRAFASQARSRVIWFSRTRRVDGVFLSGDDIVQTLTGSDAAPERLAARADSRLPGEHNLENALAASALALAAGAEAEHVRSALRRFHGAPDRLELVRELDGVAYVNDTT